MKKSFSASSLELKKKKKNYFLFSVKQPVVDNVRAKCNMPLHSNLTFLATQHFSFDLL